MFKLLKFIKLISFVTILFVGIFFVNKYVSAQLPVGYNPCWTEAECGASDGVWGKTKSGATFKVNDGLSDKCVAMSDGSETAKCWVRPPNIPLQIAIPGITEKFCSVSDKNDKIVSCQVDEDCKNNGLGFCRPGVSGGFAGYLAKFYSFFISMLAVIAVVMVTWGGFKRIMAAGNSEKITASNETIFGAIIGLVLALVSYSLLNLINPQLVANTGANMEKIKTQAWGNWCDNDLKKDDGKYVMCNEEYKDKDGATCRGQRCGTSGTGCYPLDYKDGKKVYSCATPKGACMYISINNVEDIFGQADEHWGTGILSEDSYAWSKVCRQFSDSDGRCSWFDEGKDTNSDYGGCTYTTNTKVQEYCRSKPFDASKPCKSYFISYGLTELLNNPAKQMDWAACHEDWCDLKCHVTRGANSWNCVKN